MSEAADDEAHYIGISVYEHARHFSGAYQMGA
jgi:hypothetical protein